MLLKVILVLALSTMVDGKGGSCKKMEKKISKLTNAFTKKCTKPVDGGWTSYSDWSDCSTSCGTGSQTRDRTCSNPAPADGGRECDGSGRETRQCSRSDGCEGTCAWGGSYQCQTQTACSWSCYNGYCWKGCNGANCPHPDDGFCSNCKSWCWLTVTGSEEKASCSSDSDCEGLLDNPCFGGAGCNL
ncbi:hypothetical protein ACHWQZ_G013119 [Mnemiopsis leidyi]